MHTSVVVVVVALEEFVLANAPNPDVPPPKTLGFDVPIVPKGEELDCPNEANPELAKADEDVCGLLVPSVVPNTGFGEEVRDLLDSLSEELLGEPFIGSLLCADFAVL